jgi:hypothetical protein
LEGVEALFFVLPLFVHRASHWSKCVLLHLCGKKAVHDEKVAYTCNALWVA